MLIKIEYPNLLHGYDFLCFNFINYLFSEFENKLYNIRPVNKVCMGHIGRISTLSLDSADVN